jgi:hypothetical protein
MIVRLFARLLRTKNKTVRSAIGIAFGPAGRSIATRNDPTRTCRLDRITAAWAGTTPECHDERCQDHHPTAPAAGASTEEPS